jgi:hypothetical protein
MDDPVRIVLMLASIAAIAAATWLYLQLRRPAEPRRSTDPEDDDVVQDHDDQRSVARALDERQERLEHLRIRALSPDERARFAERWRSVQAQFVDDPGGATRAANQLVDEVMWTRGYPAGDFEQRSADVSVDHPRVVEHRRAAHAIARRNVRRAARAVVDAEGMRQDFVDYRALLDDLLVDDFADAETRVPGEARR